MNIDEFHAEQYRELRAEALKHVDETRLTERYALIGLAAYYGFLFPKEAELKQFGAMPWWIPSGLVLCAIFRSWALFMSIENNAEYLRKLEETFIGKWDKKKKVPVGWEQFRLKELPWKRKGLLNSALIFWPLLFVGTFVVAGRKCFELQDWILSAKIAGIVVVAVWNLWRQRKRCSKSSQSSEPGDSGRNVCGSSSEGRSQEPPGNQSTGVHLPRRHD